MRDQQAFAQAHGVLPPPGLRITQVWEDDSLLEVRVTAFNGSFMGTVEVYTTHSHLLEWANSLQGFPQTPGQVVNFTAGSAEALPYCAISVSLPPYSGLVKVHVDIRTPEAPGGQAAAADFALPTELGQLDRFVLQLKGLLEGRVEMAFLPMAGN